MALGGALFQEPDPRDGGVRRRQGRHQRPVGEAFTRRARRRSLAHHAAAVEEDRARGRAVGPPGTGSAGAAPLRGPDPATAAARGARLAACGATARGRSSDQAGAPPDRPSPALLTALAL